MTGVCQPSGKEGKELQQREKRGGRVAGERERAEYSEVKSKEEKEEEDAVVPRCRYSRESLGASLTQPRESRIRRKKKIIIIIIPFLLTEDQHPNATDLIRLFFFSGRSRGARIASESRSLTRRRN